MPAFLSDEWLGALGDAAARAAVPHDVSVAVGHVVRTGGGDVRWTLVLREGRAAVSPGTTDGADVVLHQDDVTAAALHRGELTAQEAVAQGRLKVSGDVRRLVAATAALAGLGLVVPGD